MNERTPLNLPASVRQRLLNRSRKDQRPFSELLQYYAMERFLYRLSKSSYADRFILKGGFLLRAWQSSEIRPTLDIDMLGITNNEESAIISKIHEIIALDVEPDGLNFDQNSIRTERIIENAYYEGVRILFNCTLGSARVYLQIDIGFGDIVYPGPEKINLTAMLNYPKLELLCYSRESVIAEKFQIMIKLGEMNSRMKDFYDILILSRCFNFEGQKLSEAIRLTFKRRETTLPEKIFIFTEDFSKQKQVQWTVFRNRIQQEHIPSLFKDVLKTVSNFLLPVAEALNSESPFTKKWEATGPWK